MQLEEIYRMKLFTIRNKKKNEKINEIAAIIFWLLIWQIASMKINQEILLVSPGRVLLNLFTLVREKTFWSAVIFSITRILLGFFLGMVTGVTSAVLASRTAMVQALLKPLTAVIQATPVASFIIVALIWIPSKNLAVLISFLMSFPILYSNMLQGISQTDQKLLEMAHVFRISFFNKVKAIYLPQVYPYFTAASSVSMGLCWKAGIAAEIIGIPKGSMGEKLYNAKIYLQTADLFGYTLVIILLSIALEKLLLKVIRTLTERKSDSDKSWSGR